MSEYFRKYIKKEYYPVHYSTIKFKTTFRNCIYDAMKRRGWKETDEDTDYQGWDMNWAEKEWIHEVMDHTHLSNNQHCNHYRNHYELTRKDLMIKNLKRHKKQLEKDGLIDQANQYDFYPVTYNLPIDYSIFVEEFKKQNTGTNKDNYWIMKPVGKSQGKGIFIFSKIQQISQWKSSCRYNPDNPQAEPYVVQRYISDPLIIGGKKFDMRIYCLCVSYQPLVCYLYRTGFARFTHHRYDNEDVSNVYVHLTNVAIQKTSDNYDQKIGGKWELQQLKLYLLSKYGNEKVNEAFNNIQDLIIKTLQSVQKVIINDKHCFELYGFDILFDAQLKPWLIEVNASPSMTANTPNDCELKLNLLDDAFSVLDKEKIFTGQEEQIGGFDLICKGTPVKLPTNSSCSSFLGAYNNRSQQLKRLAKSTAIRLAQQFNENKDNGNNVQTLQKGKVLSQQAGPSIGPPKKLGAAVLPNQKIISKLIKPGQKQKSTSSEKSRIPVAQQSIINTNITLAQTTAYTQNVINNINNMTKNKNYNDQYNLYQGNRNNDNGPVNDDDEEEEEEEC